MSNFVSVKHWIDEWDFKNENTATYTHKIHRYPAMFIPQLVNKILQEYSDQGDTVLDIFNGSGSTMIEASLLNRKSIGIEINPLAIKITQAKTDLWDVTMFETSYELIKKEFYNDDFSFNELEFDRMNFWFSELALKNLGKLFYCIKLIKDEKIQNFFEISFSEIIREVSLCKHSGFKQHKDPVKEKNIWDQNKLFERFAKTLKVNFSGYQYYYNSINNSKPSLKIIEGDSKKYFEEIGEESVDLILTSPPYGDSSTTVAYGQFSKMSSQILGLKSNNNDINPANLDKELLGGKIKNITFEYSDLIEKSRTLHNSFVFFDVKIQHETSEEQKKKLKKRFRDVICFYKDLDFCIKNGVKYLKKEKYFILVTGSRVVKEIKLHTDLICAEFAEFYGMNLEAILYRKIPNKRMPAKVSSTNKKGDITPTMTTESIVILKKI